MNHVISLLEEYIGKKAEISCKPFHRADLKATLADITKAKNILDWMPLISLEEGLKRTVDWYKDNSSWIKDLHIDLSK
jgi:nucleoside-diphosphate-sugar epimerase